MNRKNYHAKEFSPGRWHIIAPDGFPIYDDAPYGKDRPLTFDEDSAYAMVTHLNVQLMDDCAEQRN